MFHIPQRQGGVIVGSQVTDNAIDIAAVKNWLGGTTEGLSLEANEVMASIAGGTYNIASLENLCQSFEQEVLGADVINAEGYKKNETALQVAGLLRQCGGNPRKYLDMFTSESAAMAGDAMYATSMSTDWKNMYSQEAFDNQSLTDNLAISIGLAYNVARQGHMTELIYKLIALTPEQGAVDVEFDNLFITNAVQHSATGDLSKYDRKRVIDASIDHRIVADNATTLIPQIVAGANGNEDKFVPSSVVTPFLYSDADSKREVLTSALVVGKKINLLGLSNLDTIQRNGQADHRDALDRNLGIKDLYLNMGSDTLVWSLRGIPYTRWVKGPEQGARELKLNVELTSLFIDGRSERYDGTDLSDAVFDVIKDGGYRVRLAVQLSGSADVQDGWAMLNEAGIEVKSIQNEAGAFIDLTTGVGKDIVDGLADLRVRGWWPAGRVTNSNLRYLGQLADVRGVRERLATRTRSPVYVPYPSTENRDQQVLNWLTYIVGKQINADGITALFDYHQRLTDLVPGGKLLGDLTPGDFEQNLIPMEGVGRYLINPYVDTVDIDLTVLTQSLQTTDNVRNAVEALTNTVRATAFNILQKTGYEHACAYLDGGEIKRDWRFALATSKYIENFLTKAGDSRTFGAGLPFEIRSDIDDRMDEVMFMTLVRDGDGIDPLSGGVLLYTASMVATVTTTRQSAHNKECIMQPRYEYYNLLPIIVRFNVKGVKELLEQLRRFQVEFIEGAAPDAGNGGTGGTPGTPTPVAPGTGGGTAPGGGTGTP